MGNRLSSLGVSPYAYNSSNELTSTPSATYTYDHNGNTTAKTDSSGTTTYNWNSENQLTSVVLPGSGGTVSFKYDPFGRRIQKSSTSGTANYFYDGDNLLEELDNAGNVVSRYTPGPGVDQPFSELRSGTTSYYEQDGLGSVTSLSNSGAALASTYTYDSFGKISTSTGSIINPFQYAAREADTETGLQYYRARYYDASVGRFLSEDPLGFDAGNNFYNYVENDPIALRDPFGLQALPKPVPAPPRPGPQPVPAPGPEPVSDPEPAPRGPLAFCIANPEVCLGIIYLIHPPNEQWANSQEAQMENQPAEDRAIKKPPCPKRGCTCTCRADADDTMPGNIQEGMPLFAFGTVTASSCAEAAREAKRAAIHSLAMKPKHVGCRCTER